MNSIVSDNPGQSRFEMKLSDDAIAVAYYRMEGQTFVLTHTEVPGAFAGHGVASRLAKGVFAAIRARGSKAAVRCEFMGHFIATHPEYLDVISG